MKEKYLRTALRKLELGGLRYFPKIGSTNDVALAWAAEGAPDMSLVCADEQTQGRGRGDRRWITNPKSALAFSLVLRPSEKERSFIPLFSALGALAVAEVLETTGLIPQIKWPNDVLLDRKKVCGILAESVWTGDRVESVVLGIGLNVREESIPSQELLIFPATSLESNLNCGVVLESLLSNILSALLEWRPRMGSEDFIRAWEGHLAYKGETVMVLAKEELVYQGVILGLEHDGTLRISDENGRIKTVQYGELSLRPVV